MTRIALLIASTLGLLALLSAPAAAAEHGAAAHEEHEAGSHEQAHPQHWISIFGGGAAETKRPHTAVEEGELHTEEETEHAGAIGVEYYLELQSHWGVGALVEHLGDRIDRNYSVFLPIGFHPNHRWRLVLAPGMEFTEDDEEWVGRLGVNYLIPLAPRWELAPEIDVDFIEGGKITYVYGVLLGFRL